MKKFLLSWLAMAVLSVAVTAQCVTCTPSMSGCAPAGGICGHSAVGMVNHPYTTNISFYMPKHINDPAFLSQCSCSQINLNQIKVTGVGGLPTGINAFFNHANQTYDVANGDSLGCVNFCGTPLAAGTYPVTVYIEAHVMAIGTPIGNVDPGPQNQTYKDTMIILPDTSGAVSSFNYTPHVNSDCDSLTLGFNALLTAPTPNPTSYSWDFGNGQTSAAQAPAGTQTYNTPGIHPVSLKTVFYKFRIKKVHVYNITGGFYPDIEELTAVQNPDPYIKLTTLGYTSGNVSNTASNVDYNNLNLVLPLGTDTVPLELWDADNGPPFGSADDLIGTYYVTVGSGQIAWANGNASGYVEFDTVYGTAITDTLKVNIQGRPAMPTLVVSSDSVCFGDSARLSISPAYSNVKYEWWRDSTYLLTATDSVYYAKQSGLYHVKITNLTTGCSTEMDTPYYRVSVSSMTPTSANLVYSSGNAQVFLNPFLPGSVADWYYNGTLVTGQHGQILPILGNGTYTATVYATGFPQCKFESQPLTVTGVGVEETPANIYALSVYPNPNNGTFTIKANVLQTGEVTISIADVLGREVYTQTVENQYGEISQNVDISGLAKDVYTVTVSNISGKATSRIVVR